MGQYKLLDRIGEGAMGIVYRASDQTGQEVAVKLLPTAMTSDQTARARFVREVQACTSLKHPNIIRILDCGEMQGQPYYAMELLRARTLKEMLVQDGAFPIPLALSVFRQVLAALEYCHIQGIFHRDIKPQNIMVDSAQHVTLMDFGLVKIMERSVITAHDKILGTPYYYAPEIIRSGTASPQSDLFSLGTAMYELLTGQKAFKAATIKLISREILTRDPMPIRDIRSEVPVGLSQIIDGCLVKDPGERYISARSVLTDLDRFGTGRPPRGPAGANAEPSVTRQLPKLDLRSEPILKRIQRFLSERGMGLKPIVAALLAGVLLGLLLAFGIHSY
jgi:serine/threonine protein kinase